MNNEQSTEEKNKLKRMIKTDFKKLTVSRIRDILVWIRILGLTDPHPNPALDPALFLSDLQDANKNLLFCLFHFEGTFTSFFNDNKS